MYARRSGQLRSGRDDRSPAEDHCLKLADTNCDNAETGCCARLDTTKWGGKEIEWKDQLFLKDHIRVIFHMPINMGAVMGRDQKVIEEAAAYPADPIWLSDEVSPWGSDVYVAGDHPVPGTETVKLSGKFVTMTFEGPYRDIGKWLKAMDAFVAGKGYETKRHLFYYATCPKCAKTFGKNQVVVFSEVASQRLWPRHHDVVHLPDDCPESP